jgi:hypothetical protein
MALSVDDRLIKPMGLEMYDDLKIPAFLRREITPEYTAHIKRITARYAQRKIKNPPKRVTKRMRTGLGGAFGCKPVER